MSMCMIYNITEFYIATHYQILMINIVIKLKVVHLCAALVLNFIYFHL